MLAGRLCIPLVMAAATVPLSPTAAASTWEQWVSPSGEIFCGIAVFDAGDGIAECELDYRAWRPPPRPENCVGGYYGDRIVLLSGKPAAFECYGDTLHDTGLPILGYGESVSVGSFTCVNEAAGTTCTDNTTGHYFMIGPDTYELG